MMSPAQETRAAHVADEIRADFERIALPLLPPGVRPDMKAPIFGSLIDAFARAIVRELPSK